MSRMKLLPLLSIPFVVSTFLAAQVDPRLQACKTDVLDVYSGGKQGAKPEIITLIDNSGSMEALGWDSRFYANVSTNIHVGASTAFGNSSGDNSVDYFQVVSSSLYNDATHGNIRYTVSFGGVTEGLLIKPDGTPVVSSDVSNASDVQKWVARSSHVRFAVTSKSSGSAPTYTYGGIGYALPSSNCGIKPKPFSNSGNYSSSSTGNIATSDQTRVVDIPLPWAVFDRVPDYEKRSLSPSPASLSTAKTDKHPQHMYLYDPVPLDDTLPVVPTATAQYYEVDTNWWASTGNGGRNGALVNGSGQFDYIRVHPEYLAWCFFGQDIRNQNETGAFQGGMVDKYLGTNDGGYTVPDARDGAAGFRSFTRDGVTMTGNGLPNMTRLQAVKYAVIRTYINEQMKVWWGIRFLKLGSQGFQENGRSSASKVFSSSNTAGNPGDRQVLRLYRPTSANNPDPNMDYIQRMGAPNNTPLTFALLNTYAQMASTDNGTSGSVFSPANDAYKGENPIPSCRRSFVVVLSDGNPNDDNSNANGSNGGALGTGDPFSGGSFPTIAFNTIGPTKANFNIWSLAAVAAHITPSAADATNKSGWPTDNDNAGVLPPFLVTSRPSGVTRRISTMTIGISMAGKRGADAQGETGAKSGMYRTALYGWEQRGSYDSTNLPMPFDPTDSTRKDTQKNPFFFDAQSPESIADALAETFAQARAVTNTMSAPVAPLVGLGVGKQMYLGTFTTASNQAAWVGDLLMTGMSTSGGTVRLLDKGGSPLTSGININSAIWSASVMLKAKGWQNRTIYTLKPDPLNTGKFLKDLLVWNQSTSLADLPNATLGVSTDANRRSLMRFMMGASKEAQDDAAAVTSIATSRDDLMGDIINSTPAILQFPLSKVPSGTLSSWLSSNSSLQDKRFRLIIVGDNQGILHGFGEVSGVDSGGLVQAAVDELWGIIPPDILGGLQTWRTGTIHRYLVDGSPMVYLNEQGTPNGQVDGTDIVRVVFGLRKGGRSYYALSFDSNDPTLPLVPWMVRPDDSSDLAIKSMGFSTSTPAPARVFDGGVLKDVFFLGGGLSTLDVDAAFGSSAKLGRSVIAVSVLDGTLVKSWDFINNATLKAAYPSMGCIPAGAVPIEVLQGSFKTQRVYFSDFSGGVYALGAKASSGMRVETSDMSGWNVRTIFHTKYAGTPISSSPAIFPLPYGYPVVRDSAPTAMVPATGVVFGMGDRNDPMDLDSINPGGGGTAYRDRLVMVLDRQDSADVPRSGGGSVDALGYSEDDVADLTSVASTSDARISTGSTTYYLKSKSGYMLNYAVGTAKPSMSNAWYYEKSVTAPLVLNSGLFFSKFAPLTTAGVCSGAGGTTYTYSLCDVMNPVFGGGTTTTTGCNGYYVSYNDIPSELATAGMRAVIQVGEVQNAGTGVGTVAPTVIPPPPNPLLPRPRAWRIIR